MLPLTRRWRSFRVFARVWLLLLLSVALAMPGFALQPAAAADLAAGFGPVTFDNNAAPTGWTVLPASGPGWTFNDPGQRGNKTGANNTTGFAIADSDKAGRVAMDTQLRSPSVDLSGASSARLTFDTIFQAYEQSTADVDFSIDGGTNWTNLWRTTAGTSGKITLNLPAAALGQANVILRFRYYNAFYSWYWQLDNIQLTVQATATPPTAPSNVTTSVAGSQVTVRWTDNSNDETGFKVERSTDGTNWASLGTVAPNSTGARDVSAACGTSYSYRVLATSAAGNSAASNAAAAQTAACAGTTTIDEAFTTVPPTGWTITPATGAIWRFDDPGNRTNQTGGAGTFAIADSDNAGRVAMDTVLQSPTLNLSGSTAVELSFKTFFKVYSAATADVDVSSDGGATWTNVWRKTANFNGTVTLDISAQAGGKSNVQLRFRYYGANYDWYWQVDDVKIGGATAPAVPTNLTATQNAGKVNLAWNGNAPRYEVERQAGTGAWSRIANITNGAKNYVDQPPRSTTADVTYNYRVRAANGGGTFSGYSNTVNQTIQRAVDNNGNVTNNAVRSFDVTISLYRPTVDATTRANYERILRYFADSVYEMSNGAHKLRNIKIYTGGANKDQSQIIWVQNCHPSAHVSGYGKPGWRVNMCDVFSDQTYLENDGWAQVGGYGSLGHEWGHYFYGLYDEYRGGDACDPNQPSSPCSGDTPVPNALMHNGDPAGNVPGRSDLNGDLSWANFSTAVNNTRNTAQHRVFGASSWETLARPPSQDPRTGNLSNLPTRNYWPELANVAPAAGQAPRLDVNTEAGRTAARSELTITWLNAANQVIAATGANAALAQTTSGVVRQIVIDRSARISNAGLLNDIKAAVQQLVDDAAIGDTIGVIAFDGTASVIQTPTVINSAADRTAIKNAIAGITLSSSPDADLNAALQAALGGLNTNALSNYVYLITGGAETTGNNPFGQVTAYQNAGVPIYVFAYPNEDDAALQALAEETDGLYQAVSNDGYNNLGNALENALQETSPVVDVDIKEDVLFVESGTESIPFVVDSTLGFITVEAYFEGLPEDAILELVDPDGTATELTCESDGEGSGRDAETFCYADIDAPATGNWTLDVTAENADGVDLYYWIGGTGKDGEFTYATTVASVSGQFVDYPKPIVVRASIEREIILKGVNVSAQLIAPDGEVSELELRDDGVAPDFEANDGKYAGIFDYTMDGEYFVLVNFNNADGNAMTTIESFQLQRGVGDNIPQPETITENFERSAFTQITVRGWQEDDHLEEIESATTLPTDNTPVAGKIDFADDGDTFVLTAPSGGGEITVRVSDLGLGMDPYLYIYTLDGSIDQEAFLETEPTSDDYLTVPLNLQANQTVYITVLHFDEAAEIGFYSISAGPALPLEASRNSPAKPANESLVYLPLVSLPAE